MHIFLTFITNKKTAVHINLQNIVYFEISEDALELFLVDKRNLILPKNDFNMTVLERSNLIDKTLKKI